MKVMAINGSPRKKWNTATMLEHALEGAASKGAETELVHLYDLNFKGCTSCFVCKQIGGKSYGHCAFKDDLTPVLRKIETVDALILGSPIYWGCVTGEMRSCMERLLFQYLTYSRPPKLLTPRKIKIGFIYTMNVPEEAMKDVGYDKKFEEDQRLMEMMFGSSEYLAAYDTHQFKDYSKVDSTMFDVEKKLKRHQEVFPVDCQKAFEMGARFAQAD